MGTIMAPFELTIGRQRFVAVPEKEYKRLTSQFSVLPPADKEGNRDAVRFAEAAIARNIVRRRKAAGLSQKQLAEKAGIRVEVLNRAERGVVVPSTRTLAKIEVALAKR